jgi:WD40 repeat protein
MSGHDDYVLSAAFSPDGKRIVTGAADNTARIWDVAGGKQITMMGGHSGWVEFVGFGQSGARVVTASADNTARIWDAANGKEMLVLRGHESRVWSAALNRDESYVVTSSADKTARIWDVRLVAMAAHDLVTEACGRRLRGRTTFTREEMQLAGYADDIPAIDVCAGFAQTLP